MTLDPRTCSSLADDRTTREPAAMQNNSVMTPMNLNNESSTLPHLTGTNQGLDVDDRVGVGGARHGGARPEGNDTRSSVVVEGGDRDDDVKMNSQEKSVVSIRDYAHA